MKSEHKAPSPGADAISRYFSESASRFRAQYGRRPDFQERLRVWETLFEKYAAGAQSAIDVGCGAGTFSFLLARRGVSVLGIDAAPGMVALCREELQRCPQLALSFVDGSLPALAGISAPPADLVFSSSVLEYVPDLALSLRRMRELLKPHGTMLVSLPNAQSCYRRLERLAYRLVRKPAYLRFVYHHLTPVSFGSMLPGVKLKMRDTIFYARTDPVSRACRLMRLPEATGSNLFVAVLARLD